MADPTAADIAAKARNMLEPSLLDMQHCYGDLAANAYATGFVQAAVKHFVATLGPAAAYELMMRHADGILEPDPVKGAAP